jgi:uncharacterized phage-associated protein
MESPLAIANYFIKKSFDEGKELTPMKLVKLVYLAHGWYLGLKGTALINEPVSAWKYGPVIESLYHIFKRYGNEPIRALEPFCGIIPIAGDELGPFLDKIWDVYGEMSALELSTLTHQTNTPWDKVWHRQNGRGRRPAQIGNDCIRQYYLERINVSA